MTSATISYSSIDVSFTRVIIRVGGVWNFKSHLYCTGTETFNFLTVSPAAWLLARAGCCDAFKVTVRQ